MSSITATADQTYGAVQITGTTTIVSDAFGRTSASSFGSADTGQTYTVTGGTTADYAVNSGVGKMTLASTNVSRKAILATVVQQDMDELVLVSSAVTGVGAPIDAGILLRYVDASNYYFVDISFQTSGHALLRISQNIAGVTTLGLGTTYDLGTYTPGQWWAIRARITGSTITARAWGSATSVDPGNWMVSYNNASAIASGSPGLRAITEPGNTNTSPVISFDDFHDPGDELVYLVRTTPDGVSTVVRGSPEYSSGNSYLFWDDEAPLNTAVTYTVTVGTDTLVSSPVTITGTGGLIGWIKDPVKPTNDIKLTFNIRSEGCIQTSGVGLVSFGDETYGDNDGSYSIINATRPIIVSQVRDDAIGSLVLTTITMADYKLLKTILASGRNLLLQLPPTTYNFAPEVYNCDWLHIGDAKPTRPALAVQSHNERSWALPYTLARPSAGITLLTGSNGVGVGRANWQTMKASGLTWAQLTATGKTITQLAQGQGY